MLQKNPGNIDLLPSLDTGRSRSQDAAGARHQARSPVSGRRDSATPTSSHSYPLAAVEVCDGSRHAQCAVLSARAQ